MIHRIISAPTTYRYNSFHSHWVTPTDSWHFRVSSGLGDTFHGTANQYFAFRMRFTHTWCKFSPKFTPGIQTQVICWTPAAVCFFLLIVYTSAREKRFFSTEKTRCVYWSIRNACHIIGFVGAFPRKHWLTVKNTCHFSVVIIDKP